MKKITFIAFTLINFHIIKDINIVLSLPIFIIYTFFFIKSFSLFNYKYFFKDRYLSLLFIIFIMFIFLSMDVLIDSDLNSLHKILTLGRLNFTYPIFFLCFFTLNQIDDYKRIINIYIFFNLISAIFLIFSVLFDNNLFLQNEFFSFKTRDNLIRYSTLYGSVGQTGYALSLPIFMLFMAKYKRLYKSILLVIFFIAVTLTLSRSAYFNVILTMALFYILSNHHNKISESIFILLSLIIFTPVFMYFLGLYNYYDYFIYKIIGKSTLNIQYSVSNHPSDLISIVDRIHYSLLKDFTQVINNESISSLNHIFGNGYKFMGISLGLFNFQMDNIIYVHNGFYEIFFSSGIVFFLAVILLFYLTIKNLIRLKNLNERSILHRVFLGSVIIIFINIYLGASLIHPNLIVFFWVIVSFVSHSRKDSFIN